MTTWDELFERAASFDATEGAIADALRARREGGNGDESGGTGGHEREGGGEHGGEDRA